jgi:hypothetical protein
VTERQLKVDIEIFGQRGRKKRKSDKQRHTESERQTGRQADRPTDT